MSTTINCPAGFFQDDTVTPSTTTDLLSAVAAAEANVNGSLASANAAAASAAAASVSETNAAGSASSAGSSASSSTASAAGASASAATATTQASNAGSSATAASGSATAASGSASAASTSASGASTSATNAGNSATNAATSATNASNSATTASNAAASVFFPGMLGGLTLSFSSTTVVGISAGSCTDSTAAAFITLASAFTKSTAGTWVAGSGNNGMGQGLTIANTTWYHVFAIIKSGAADVYFDTSVSAANKPAGTTAFRRLGSFFTGGSAQIFSWVQNGDEFVWGVGALDVSAVSIATASRSLKTLTVPPGVQVNALCRVTMSNAGSAAALIITSPDETDQSGIGDLACPTGGVGVGGRYNVRTNTSGQIALRCITSASIVNVQTYGWVDIRGRG